MGGLISAPGASLVSMTQWLWRLVRQDSSILILGLDNAGKTAVLYGLQLGQPIEVTVPTLGFNVEELQVGRLRVKMWDMGGQNKFRALWSHYFEMADAVAFVVDSNDRERLGLVREELHALMSHKDLTGKPFLVLANKQDLPLAVNKVELTGALGLATVTWSPWHVVACSATKNDRARLGFEWLAGQL